MDNVVAYQTVLAIIWFLIGFGLGFAVLRFWKLLLVVVIIAVLLPFILGLAGAVTPFTPQEDFLKQQLFERIKSAVNIAKDPAIPETRYKKMLQKLPFFLVLQMFEEVRQQA